MKSFSGIRAALVGACIASLIGLFVGQSMATAEPIPSHPTASAAERTQSAPTAPPPVPPKVAWPDNGIAQRRLEGGFNYNMFVENDNGTWRAWVQSDMSGGMPRTRTKAKALDFFSGQQLMVKASVDEESKQQEPGFIDPRGSIHGPHDQSFEFNRGEAISSRYGGEFSLEAINCPVNLGGIQGGVSQGWEFHPTWIKIPMILDRSNTRKDSPCKDGRFFSVINSTLDLNDGTVLVTMSCWVFRLRRSDLSPVGNAPALRIVDGAAMNSAIDKAKGQPIEDARAYLDRALDLNFDAAYACRSTPTR